MRFKFCPQKLIYKVFLFFIVLILSFFSLDKSCFAEELFFDDFSGDLSQWSPVPGDEDNWEIDNETLHLYENVPWPLRKFTRIFTNEGSDWKNYKVKTKIKGIEGVDQAILIRVKDVNNHYRITFRYGVPSNQAIELAAMQDGVGIQLGDYLYSYAPSFQYGIWYDVKLEIKDFYIKVDVKKKDTDWENVISFELPEENRYFEEGKIGLNGWVGGGGVQTIHFIYDDILVNSINDSEGPGLDVPYFMQTDEEWAKDTYDKAGNWDLTGNPTIANYGCALTSAVMVLNFYGITELEDGTPLTPRSLNKWLNENIPMDDWWRQGHTNWTAIAGLTNMLYGQNGTPKLEFIKTMPQSFSAIASTLEAGIPIILEIAEPLSPSNVHFIVAKGFDPDTGDLLVLDPFDETRTSISELSTTLWTVNKFYETESDFSYLILHADMGLDAVLTNPNGERVGNDGSDVFQEPDNSWYFIQRPFYPKATGIDSNNNPFHELAIPKPGAGNYQLVFTTDKSGFYEFELHVYDQEGNPYPFKKKYFVSKNMPLIFNLSYFQNSQENPPQLVKEVSFELLIEEIKELYKLKEIKRRWLKNTLIELTRRAKFFSKRYNSRGKRMAARILRLEIKIINRYEKRYFTSPAAQTLGEDIEVLIESLN